MGDESGSDGGGRRREKSRALNQPPGQSQEFRPMACCSYVKKGLLATALTVAGLGLVFGTSAPSYVKTAFNRLRHSVKKQVPVEFDIERARREIADLEPAIRDNIESYVRAEVDVEHLKAEMVAIKDNMSKEKEELLSLRSSLKSEKYRLTGSGAMYTADEIKSELAGRWEHYKQTDRILHEKNETLKAREKAMVAARKQLETIRDQRRNLLAKVDEIEARLKAIEATQAANQFTFDDSALARAKQTVAELDNRLEVMARTAEIEGRFADGKIPVVIEPKRDVVKEIDNAFGAPAAPSPESADKSL